MERTFQPVTILPVKITVTTAGVVTVERKQTGKTSVRVIGFAITYDDITNLPGSRINIFLAGKALFLQEVETMLFTFDSACPVNDRYYNFIDEPVNNSLVEFSYLPGATFPATDTVITVSLQCVTS